jgi:hypothetical protein
MCDMVARPRRKLLADESNSRINGQRKLMRVRTTLVLSLWPPFCVLRLRQLVPSAALRFKVWDETDQVLLIEATKSKKKTLDEHFNRRRGLLPSSCRPRHSLTEA